MDSAANKNNTEKVTMRVSPDSLDVDELLLATGIDGRLDLSKTRKDESAGCVRPDVCTEVGSPDYTVEFGRER